MEIDYNGVSTIAEYRNDKWTKFGDLKTKRYRASAIFINGEHIIIGGSSGMFFDYNEKALEKW